MAAPLPMFPKHHFVPKTLAGSFTFAGGRPALVPVSSQIRIRGGDSLVAWNKGYSLYRSCSAVKAVDGVRVLEAVKDEKPIIVIDNYDSFTYNLCQYIGELGTNFKVYRNDELTVDEIRSALERLLEGPAGKIVRSPYGVVHGKGALVYYDEKLEYSLFSGLPNPFNAARYHSLVIENDSFPDDILEITAWTEDELIMGARHKKYKHIQGVQFHPESVITTEGKRIVYNFLMLIKEFEAEKNA